MFMSVYRPFYHSGKSCLSSSSHEGSLDDNHAEPPGLLKVHPTLLSPNGQHLGPGKGWNDDRAAIYNVRIITNISQNTDGL